MQNVVLMTEHGVGDIVYVRDEEIDAARRATVSGIQASTTGGDWHVTYSLRLAGDVDSMVLPVEQVFNNPLEAFKK